MNYREIEIAIEVAWQLGECAIGPRAESRWYIADLARKIIDAKIITEESEDIDEIIATWLSENLAKKIYKNGGKSAIIEAVNFGQINSKRSGYCSGCEDYMPADNAGNCLACGLGVFGDVLNNQNEAPKSFEQFLDEYGFIENTGQFACGGSIDDKSYGWETFSPDIDKVIEIANSQPGRVHTVVDGDDGRLWLTSGHHLVNRVFYIITDKPYLGPDFDVPCEDPKDFDRLDFEAFKAIDPDEEIYWAENAGYYDKQAFLDLAKGDPSLAYRIYAHCEWQSPETVIDEDLNESLEDCVFPELR